MKTFQELLCADKERFLQETAGAESIQALEKTAADELNRLLTSYNEEVKEEKTREAAASMMQVLISSLGLLDCQGKTEIYSRMKLSEEGKKKGKPFLLFAAIVLFGAGISLLAVNGKMNLYTLIGMGMSVLGAVLLYVSAKTKRRQKEKPQLYAEVKMDGEKVYHVLLGAMAGIDRQLKDREENQLAEEKRRLLHQEDLLDHKELDLLASLLESAYAQPEEEMSEEMISSIRFYLHERKIDTVDYSPEHEAWFDRLPGAQATIRPAFVMDGTLVKKGLASGGRA